MLILSKNKFYSQGVSWILKSLYQELSYNPGKSEVYVYITAGMCTYSVIDLLQGHQPAGFSVFICNEEVQELIRKSQYPGKQCYIDECASMADVRSTLKKIIVRSTGSPMRPCVKKKVRFSHREKIILEMLIKGYRTEMIASICNVDIKVAYSFRYSLMLKSGSRSLQDLYYFHLNAKYEFTDISQFLVSGVEKNTDIQKITLCEGFTEVSV